MDKHVEAYFEIGRSIKLAKSILSMAPDSERSIKVSKLNGLFNNFMQNNTG
jgi:hypothetical protein